MSWSQIRRGWVMLLALTAFSVSAWAQATTSLHGIVTDPSGGVVPGAKVTLINSETNVPRETVTTATGVYSFPAVLPGTYDLKVEAKGFQTYLHTGLILQVSLPAAVNVSLRVGAVSQTVKVTGAPPLLNTTNASLGQTMGSSAIKNLPMRAENTALLLSLQPGVVYLGSTPAGTQASRAGATDGVRGDQNNITLDGVSNNDEFSGYAFDGILPTTPYSVQEFRVTTSNYGATEGRSAGAQIDLVTKSGTNQFHGNLYEYNRNSVGIANDYFLKSAEAASGQPNVPQHLVRNVFGADIGGPLLKNRFFFFFNYQGRRIRTGSVQSDTIPSATLRQGIIQYQCVTPSQCPGMNVQGADGNNYAIPAGFYALGPTQLQQMDPLGIGPSAVALKYFQSFPMPTSAVALDAPNYANYTFASPTPSSDNWYIGRLDYRLTQSGSQTLFFRGTGVDDRDVTAGAFLPGQVPQSSLVSLSKGFVAGWTGVFGPRWVNSFRFGLTRSSYGTIGNSNQPWVYMRDMSQGVTRSSRWVSPVYNIVDTMSWLHGSHNFQFGGNLLLMRALSQSNANTFSDALTNADWVQGGGFAGKGNALDPATYGYPAVASAHAYDFPLAAMMGMASELDAVYNYKVTSLTAATPISQGSNLTRHWAADDYNLYFQDTWQAMHNLSITYGINYQLMTPVTETAGQQVEPTINMGTWFNIRSIEGQTGVPANQAPLITFGPSGSHWGGPGLYSTQSKNFAPRLGIAWSHGNTTVRAGFGMYYDNFGPELAMSYNSSGEFGLTAAQSSEFAIPINQVPRITSMNVIPTSTPQGVNIFPAAPPSTYPVTYPVVGTSGNNIAYGIDPSLKTPYSYALDFSVQHQLPGQMVLSASFVGNYAHRLLVLDDIAMPLNLVDPKTGVSYFQAASQLSQLWRNGVSENGITPATIGPTAQYWADEFQQTQPTSSNPTPYSICSTGGSTADFYQSIYDVFGPGCGNLYNETSALYLLDTIGYPVAPVGGKNSYYDPQYSSLWAWRSIGYSNYNALQLGLHKQMSNGVLFGFNYTYSVSNDMGSYVERSGQYLSSSTINAWAPQQMYGPSNFDLRNQINYYWVAQLPFGRGQMFGKNASGWANAIIGGWQWSGTGRWTSGFPTSIFMGYVWPTNWDEMGWANQLGTPSTGTANVNIGGTGYAPNIFKNPVAAAADFGYAFPGQSGTRNPIRGDGYFGLDMSLQKGWNIPRVENQTVKLRWSVYNVLNTNRFDPNSIQSDVTAGPSFGAYGSTMTSPRVMEFSLVYSF